MNTFALTLLLLTSWTRSTVTDTCVLTNTVTKQTITLSAELSYDEWSGFATVKDLYTNPLPSGDIKLIAKCRARSIAWFDVWDGYVGEDGVRHGCRVYYDAVDCRQYVNGKTYEVSGVCPRAGRIIATDVRLVE